MLTQKKLKENNIDLIAIDEVFSQVPQWSRYYISNYGRLIYYNKERAKMRINKPEIASNGYLAYKLSKPARRYKGNIVREKDGKAKSRTARRYAHRLVAQLYVNSQYPDEYSIDTDLQVHHKDKNPQNNYYKNLMYLSKNKNGRNDHDFIDSIKKIAVLNKQTGRPYAYKDIERLCYRLDIFILELIDALKMDRNPLKSADGKWNIYPIGGELVGVQYLPHPSRRKRKKK